MKKSILSVALACAALSLGGCLGSNLSLDSPAPLAQTKIDETALITADRAFDVALDVVNLCIDLKVRIPGQPEQSQPFIPGTDAAKQLATTIRTVDAALNSASSFAKAGNTTSYKQALENAEDGIAVLQTILKSRK